MERRSGSADAAQIALSLLAIFGGVAWWAYDPRYATAMEKTGETITLAISLTPFVILMLFSIIYAKKAKEDKSYRAVASDTANLAFISFIALLVLAGLIVADMRSLGRTLDILRRREGTAIAIAIFAFAVFLYAAKEKRRDIAARKKRSAPVRRAKPIRDEEGYIIDVERPNPYDESAERVRRYYVRKMQKTLGSEESDVLTLAREMGERDLPLPLGGLYAFDPELAKAVSAAMSKREARGEARSCGKEREDGSENETAGD